MCCYAVAAMVASHLESFKRASLYLISPLIIKLLFIVKTTIYGIDCIIINPFFVLVPDGLLLLLVLDRSLLTKNP